MSIQSQERVRRFDPTRSDEARIQSTTRRRARCAKHGHAHTRAGYVRGEA